MAKKARLVQDKVEYNGKDMISALADHLIVTILSLLPLKDAVITCILSKRWQNLWKNVTVLDFGDGKKMDRVAEDPNVRNLKRANYIDWVNRVIRQYEGCRLDFFAICFDFNQSCRIVVDDWIKFAALKSVQVLELDNIAFRHENPHYYPFPTRRNWPTGLKFLKILRLKCVNVCEEALSCLFSNCPALEDLLVIGCGALVKVNVSGQKLALKYLRIYHCSGLQSVTIRDTNLAAFSHVGQPINLVIANVPMLREICIGEGVLGKNVFDQLACCLHRLKILTLDMYRPNLAIITNISFPKLTNLKQLMLKVGAWGDECLLELASWIQSCPQLHKFTFQIFWSNPLRRRRKIMHIAFCPHLYLKVVEIIGYYGRVTDAELATYFFENAVNLQKMIIDPRAQILVKSTEAKNKIIKKEKTARNYAVKQLQPIKPPRVELQIL